MKAKDIVSSWLRDAKEANQDSGASEAAPWDSGSDDEDVAPGGCRATPCDTAEAVLGEDGGAGGAGSDFDEEDQEVKAACGEMTAGPCARSEASSDAEGGAVSDAGEDADPLGEGAPGGDTSAKAQLQVADTGRGVRTEDHALDQALALSRHLTSGFAKQVCGECFEREVKKAGEVCAKCQRELKQLWAELNEPVFC